MVQMGKVCMRTTVYNGEKTLRRAVDSILNQTYSDFTYYLCDNGSTDRTRKIIEEYARIDDRIVPFFNIANHVYDGNEEFVQVSHGIGKGIFFCQLDADDEYKLDFLEKMLEFMQQNNLDIAACGSDFLDAQTGSIYGLRLIGKDLVLTDENFSHFFPKAHQFMRTLWGKIYSMSLLQKCTFENIRKVSYGSDTLFAMEAFSYARRVGILAQPLHKYYRSSKSVSYKLEPKRIESDRILDDATRTFLISKCGIVSPKNNYFLAVVYFNAICDTLIVLLGAKLAFSETIQNIQNIVTNEKTQELFSRKYVQDDELDNRIRHAIMKWLLSQKESRKSENAGIVCEILLVMYPDLRQAIAQDSLECLLMKIPEAFNSLLQKDYSRVLEQLQIWFESCDEDIPVLTKLEIDLYYSLNKTNDEIFALLTEIRKRRPCSSTELNIDDQIREMIVGYPILANINASLAVDLSQTILWVLKENFSSALDEFIEVSQKLEIGDNDAESYILLGQNLSAASDNAGAYIYFKKIWISYLLDCLRNEEALKEIDEFGRLLPNDEDFSELRKRLNV